jgi:hypothetical protein
MKQKLYTVITIFKFIASFIDAISERIEGRLAFSRRTCAVPREIRGALFEHLKQLGDSLMTWRDLAASIFCWARKSPPRDNPGSKHMLRILCGSARTMNDYEYPPIKSKEAIRG